MIYGIPHHACPRACCRLYCTRCSALCKWAFKRHLTVAPGSAAPRSQPRRPHSAPLPLTSPSSIFRSYLRHKSSYRPLCNIGSHELELVSSNDGAGVHAARHSFHRFPSRRDYLRFYTLILLDCLLYLLSGPRVSVVIQ